MCNLPFFSQPALSEMLFFTWLSFFFFFFHLAFTFDSSRLRAEKGYLAEVLTFTSPTATDAGHPVTCPPGQGYVFSGDTSMQTLRPIVTGLSLPCGIERLSEYTFWIPVSHQIYKLQIFSAIWGSFQCSLWHSWKHQWFHLDGVQFVRSFFFFFWCCCSYFGAWNQVLH